MTSTINDKEIRIHMPEPFSGNRTKLRKFLQDCKIYLTINKEQYNSKECQCGFTLALLRGGDAASWKEQYVNSITNATGDINFETYAVFEAKLRESFKEVEQIQNAMQKLHELHQEKKTAEDHNIEFRLLLDQAGIVVASQTVLIDLYQWSINTSLCTKILSVETIPDTL